MKPCLTAENRANEAGEQQGSVLFLASTRETSKVLTFPISSRAKETKRPYITRYTQTGSLYYTNDWFAYAFLPIRGNHILVLKEKGILKGRNHINGIESFWSFAKHWLYKYRGIPKANFPLYLKELEWRFNHRQRTWLSCSVDY